VEFALLPLDTRVLQLSLAVMGGGGLVLGAAASELRRSHERLAQRHRDLALMNQSLTDSAMELRAVSQRLVRLEEQGQRELAVELDYELGRSIHALSTRIIARLPRRARRAGAAPARIDARTVREMQDSAATRAAPAPPAGARHPRPARGARSRPLRDMLEDAGIEYETSFYGRIEALTTDAQTTVYRSARRRCARPAAAVDARRDGAHRRAAGATNRIEVQMRLDLEASPFLEFPLEPHALPAITDRVLAQQGSYWVESLTSPG
jgi:two-component system sensor histidine kinase UhpB